MKTGSEFHISTVGLGSMGMGTALSYVRAGLSTWGADLGSNACVTLKEAGAYGVSDNIATFAERLGALLVLVVSAAQVKQVLFDETGVAQHLKSGMTVMASPTIANADAQEIATALAGFDLEMPDAPVSGDAAKAISGEMIVMASGNDIASEQLAPMLEAVAGRAYRIGVEPGLDSTVRTIHQLLAGVHIVTGAEAMTLAARVGIPLDVMYNAAANAAGNPWMFGNRMRHVVDGDYTPYSVVGIFTKDLGLVADIARALHFLLPLALTASNTFTGTSSAGYRKEDDSAAIKIFSGITLPRAKS